MSHHHTDTDQGATALALTEFMDKIGEKLVHWPDAQQMSWGAIVWQAKARAELLIKPLAMREQLDIQLKEALTQKGAQMIAQIRFEERDSPTLHIKATHANGLQVERAYSPHEQR